jgi:uncharacterized membrane protein YcgQ (UPF0703/DUF1980 family)
MPKEDRIYTLHIDHKFASRANTSYAFLVVAPHVYTKLPLLINTKYTMSSITEHLNSLNLNFWNTYLPLP